MGDRRTAPLTVSVGHSSKTSFLPFFFIYNRLRFNKKVPGAYVHRIIMRPHIHSSVRNERTKFEPIYSELSKLFKFHKGHFLEKQIQLFCPVTDDNGFKAELHIFTKFKVCSYRFGFVSPPVKISRFQDFKKPVSCRVFGYSLTGYSLTGLEFVLILY